MGDPITGPTPVKPVFEEIYPEIVNIIDVRRTAWTYLSIMEWEEVKQILIIHIWEKIHLYDPSKGTLQRWANRLISNRLINLRRDTVLRFSRPCIGGMSARGKTCVHNRGGDLCAYTPSGKQCSECDLYKDWQRTRESECQIRSSVALEHHSQEVNNIQSDFIDIDSIKKSIDKEMMKELDQWERKIYKLIYIKNLTPLQAVEELKKVVLKRKRPLKPTDPIEYQMVLKLVKEMKEMMILIIKKMNLDE